MLTVERALKSDRLLKSLTGMTIKEFNSILITFENVLRINKIKPKIRKPGGGHKHTLDTIDKKLFFILFYIKCYPTFDLAGFIFDVHRSKPHQWVKFLLPIIEQTLKHEVALPERAISSPEEFFRKFPEAKDVFVDGVERPIQRPKNKKRQKKNYSGKKKRHTKKTIVVSDEKRRILAITKTKHGRVHDKKLFDKSDIIDNIPKSVTVWADTGFIGLDKKRDNVMIPKKKPRGKQLTDEEKQNNKVISGIRVLSEHAINGIKRFGIIANIYRNHKPEIEDKLLGIASGLWNYHLRMSV